jgi:predicted ATPase
LPDIIAYMQKDELNIPISYSNKVKECFYFTTVFIVPPWKEIYKNDGERKEDYEIACMLNKVIIDTYQNFGYNIVTLPKVSVKERADLILKQIGIY